MIGIGNGGFNFQRVVGVKSVEGYLDSTVDDFINSFVRTDQCASCLFKFVYFYENGFI